MLMITCYYFFNTVLMKYSFYAVVLMMCCCFGKCDSQVSHKVLHSPPQAVYTFTKPSVDGTGKWYAGREIAQVMGAAGAGWLERSERQQEENTDAAISNMALHNNSVVADIGAGSGYYTFRLAAKLPTGKVYAVDIQEEMISLLNERKEKVHANNVIVVKGTDTTTNLPVNSINLAILVDVYHELEYPQEILRSIRQSLSDTGKILLIEYRGEDPAVPIKPLHKTTVAQLNKEMNMNGFELSYRGEFLPIQHFLLYGKTKKKR